MAIVVAAAAVAAAAAATMVVVVVPIDDGVLILPLFPSMASTISDLAEEDVKPLLLFLSSSFLLPLLLPVGITEAVAI